MTTKKVERRIKIKYRIRKSVNGTAERPRMSVFRSNKQIYVQIINDLTGTTLASASSLGMEAMPKKEQAQKVGELVAQKAQAAGITAVVFDRNGYLYHGRVKELAAAGLSSTCEPPNEVSTSWGTVPLRTGTLTKFFFADSTPLAIAVVTSPALPRP